MNLTIKFEPNLSAKDESIIYEGLLAHNVEELGLPLDEIRTKRFAFVVRKDEIIVAGLVGHIKYRSAFFDTFWVDKALRKKGLGRKLLKHAEEYAADNDCNVIFLNSLSPANIKFYEDAGYRFEFERAGYLGSYAMRYFRKELRLSSDYSAARHN